MTTPNLFIIGAQKSGTSWLHRNLQGHPEVFLAPDKELHFFSDRRKIDTLGRDGYLREYFAGVTTEKWVGEATPNYLWNTHAHEAWCTPSPRWVDTIPEVVHEWFGPGVHLLAALRDPAERAVSGYFHHLRKERITPTDNIFDVGHLYGIVHMGFYFAHLTPWIEQFGRDHLKVLIFEEATAAPKETFADLYTFLDIDPSYRPPKLKNVVYKGIGREREGNNFFLPDQDASLLKRAGDPQRVVTDADFDRLMDVFAEDILRLEHYLDRDLSLFWPSAQKLRDAGIPAGAVDQAPKRSQASPSA